MTLSDELKARFEKLAINLIDLVTSRKFWLWLVTVITAYGQKAEGAITPNAFVATVCASTVALTLAIMGEDIAKKWHSGKIAEAVIKSKGGIITEKQLAGLKK